MSNWDKRLNEVSEFELERISFYAGEKYADFKEEGTYNCASCGSATYRSNEKFFPSEPLNEFASFRAPIEGSITTKRVYSFGMKRTEVQCANCSLHLGYVFPDGKQSGDDHPEAAERHCLLSLCLHFVPKENKEIAEPEFEIHPSDVLSHLETQEEAAKEIIASGDSIGLRTPTTESEKEEKPAVTRKQERSESNESEPQKSPSKPRLTRQDTPMVSGPKESKKTPTPRSSASTSSQTRRVSPQVSQARGTPRASQPPGPQFSSDAEKPEGTSDSILLSHSNLLLPLVLGIIGGGIFLYLYQKRE